MVIHYGLCQLPDDGYQPRLADDRVGHFLSVVKDFSSDSQDTDFVRYVNRWRLERAEPVDPKNPNKLSAPKKKIVFWIEKSVPEEYRAYVREGILEWNKAFEKIGFRDAIEVRQQESEDFDPEDINYNTFRWITTDRGFAHGAVALQPAAPARSWTPTSSSTPAWCASTGKKHWRIPAGSPPRWTCEPISPIKAIRDGWGLFNSTRPAAQRSRRLERPAEPTAGRRRGPLRSGARGSVPVRFVHEARTGIGGAGAGRRGGQQRRRSCRRRQLDDLIGQAVKEVTMHEVGHTLGLRHNFKASTMLRNDQLNDVNITHKQGLVGSVMDYAPVNLAPKGVKQGDYFTTTLGPYDYWAIEYAYKPLPGGTDGEVGRFASNRLALCDARPRLRHRRGHGRHGRPAHLTSSTWAPIRCSSARIAFCWPRN